MTNGMKSGSDMNCTDKDSSPDILKNTANETVIEPDTEVNFETQVKPAEKQENEEEVMLSVTFKDFEHTQFISTAKNITFHGLDTSHPTCIVEAMNSLEYEFIGDYEYHLGHKLYFDAHDATFVGDSSKSLVFTLKKIPLLPSSLKTLTTVNP